MSPRIYLIHGSPEGSEEAERRIRKFKERDYRVYLILRFGREVPKSELEALRRIYEELRTTYPKETESLDFLSAAYLF